MDFQDLIAYKKGFQLAMDIFRITKSFPNEEKDALTMPLRRASRTACCNIAESFKERNSPELFFHQLTNSDGQIGGTLVLLEFALTCEYINPTIFEKLELQTEEVSIMINYMINNPDKFGSSKPS